MLKKIYDFSLIVSGCFLGWFILSIFSISINAPETVSGFGWNLFNVIAKIF